MKSRKLVVMHPVGLHARPAILFVKTADKYISKVRIIYKDQTANAKSFLDLLSLGITKGAKIEVIAEGEDEEEVIIDLVSLVNNNFGE